MSIKLAIASEAEIAAIDDRYKVAFAAMEYDEHHYIRDVVPILVAMEVTETKHSIGLVQPGFINWKITLPTAGPQPRPKSTNKTMIDVYFVGCWISKVYPYGCDPDEVDSGALGPAIIAPTGKDVVAASWDFLGSKDSYVRAKELKEFTGSPEEFPSWKSNTEARFALMGIGSCLTSPYYCQTHPVANDTGCALLKLAFTGCKSYSNLDMEYFEKYGDERGMNPPLTSQLWEMLLNKFENCDLSFYELMTSHSKFKKLTWDKNGHFPTFINEFICIKRRVSYYYLKTIELEEKGKLINGECNTSQFHITHWKTELLDKLQNDAAFKSDCRNCENETDLNFDQTVNYLNMKWCKLNYGRLADKVYQPKDSSSEPTEETRSKGRRRNNKAKKNKGSGNPDGQNNSKNGTDDSDISDDVLKRIVAAVKSSGTNQKGNKKRRASGSTASEKKEDNQSQVKFGSDTNFANKKKRTRKRKHSEKNLDGSKKRRNDDDEGLIDGAAQAALGDIGSDSD